MKCMELPRGGKSIPVGMGDFELLTPNGGHRVQVVYRGEPPHGDSYHDISVDGVAVPGYAWGRNFACTEDGRYLALSWMAKLYDRTTAVIDMAGRKHLVLPAYIYDFAFHWPRLEGVGQLSAHLSYEFVGDERWMTY